MGIWKPGSIVIVREAISVVVGLIIIIFFNISLDKGCSFQVPGIDGLIHISQIANKRIGKPQDVLSVGETVEAMITDINWETKKVALSIRALLPEEAPQEAAPQEEAPAETEE